jgi:hypothetical protein
LRPAVTFQKRAMYELRPRLLTVLIRVVSRGHFSEKGYVRVASQAAESLDTSCVPRSLFEAAEGLGMRCVPRSLLRYSTCVAVVSHAAAVKMEPVRVDQAIRSEKRERSNCH